jgi:hypothetical protein
MTLVIAPLSPDGKDHSFLRIYNQSDNHDLIEVLERRLKQLGFTIDADAKWKIINLARN